MRRLAAVIAAVIALGTLGLPAPLTAQDFDAVQIRAQSLGNGIYMLMGQGGNIGLSVGEDGVFIVDDQFAPLTDKILRGHRRDHLRIRSLRLQHALARRPHGRQREPGTDGRPHRGA